MYVFIYIYICLCVCVCVVSPLPETYLFGTRPRVQAQKTFFDIRPNSTHVRPQRICLVPLLSSPVPTHAYLSIFHPSLSSPPVFRAGTISICWALVSTWQRRITDHWLGLVINPYGFSMGPWIAGIPIVGCTTMTSHIPRFDHGTHTHKHMYTIYAQRERERERKRDRYLNKKLGMRHLKSLDLQLKGWRPLGIIWIWNVINAFERRPTTFLGLAGNDNEILLKVLEIALVSLCIIHCRGCSGMRNKAMTDSIINDGIWFAYHHEHPLWMEYDQQFI